MARVLIVEDTNEFASMLETALKNRGDTVMIASNETKAHEMLMKEEFDLVYLDLSFEERPLRDEKKFAGLDILRHIRKNYPMSMVIVASGYSEKILESLEMGAYDFIAKGNSDIRDKLLIKAESALIFRENRMREVEEDRRKTAGLDSNHYLTINTSRLIEQLKKDNAITLDADIDSGALDLKKLTTLTDAVADGYIRKSGDDKEKPLTEIICKLISENKKLDVLLYLTQKRYRDHYQHQFLVGALGWFLLDMHIPAAGGKNISLINLIKDKGKLTEEEIGRAWWTAALLHDHGYPLSHILKSVMEINKIDGDIIAGQDIAKKMKSIYDSYKNVFSRTLLEMIGEKNPDVLCGTYQNNLSLFLRPLGIDSMNIEPNAEYLFDHGLIAAVNLVSFLEEKLKSQIEARKFISERRWLQESLLAIAFHNNLDLGSEKKLTFEKYPIAFLLKLCDELQEWDRKTFYKEIFDNDFRVETRAIKLGRFQYEPGSQKYVLMKDENSEYFSLNVIFEFFDEETLSKTGWNLAWFENAKQKHLSALNVEGSFLKKINFVVSKIISC